MAGCPSSHQPTRIRKETLESGGPHQRKLNFRLRTNIGHCIIYLTCDLYIINAFLNLQNSSNIYIYERKYLKYIMFFRPEEAKVMLTSSLHLKQWQRSLPNP